ncbi:MAG: hypothetical protein RLZ42_1575 [Armatimonadota bacterium]
MASTSNKQIPTHAVLGVLAFLVSVLFAAMVPFGNNPDETAHWDNIRLISATKRLPVFVPPPGRAPLPENVVTSIQRATGMTQLPEGALSRDEAHQPPFYYLLAAILKMAGGDFLTIRLLSAVLAGLTVAYCCKWIGTNFGDDYVRPLGAFLCVLPVQAQLGGAVSNDALTHLLCAIIIGEALTVIRSNDIQLRALLLLGAAITVGLYTKLTILQLLPWLVIVAAVYKAKTTGLTVKFCSQFTLMLVAVGILTAPMWLRNLTLYADPLARTIYVATGPNFSPADIEKVAGWSHADYIRQVAVRSLASFWYFIHPNTPLSRFAGEPLPFIGIMLVITPALVGIIRAFRDPERRGNVALMSALLLAPVVIMPFYFAFISQVFQAQGRYFLPALLPISVLTIVGWKQLSKLPWLAYAPAVILGLLTIKQLLSGGFASQ